MAQETNPSLTPVLCATGCGFYGNPRNNGMCSVCYKEHLNRQQKQSSDCGLSQLSPMGAVGSSTADASAIQRLEASLAEVDTSSGSAADMARTIQGSLPVTQQMTEMSISREDNPDSLEPVVSQPTASSPVTASSDEVKEDTPKPKKNKCFMCRKRVGLTGFDCRCGNLFCGVHRYSDKHNCPYDYKAEAAAKIRKENPVVVADKIQRI